MALYYLESMKDLGSPSEAPTLTILQFERLRFLLLALARLSHVILQVSHTFNFYPKNIYIIPLK